jgi:hypothetical protein
MDEQLAAANFVYVDSDIPPGVTIAEWRAQRSLARRSRRWRLRRLRQRVRPQPNPNGSLLPLLLTASLRRARVVSRRDRDRRAVVRRSGPLNRTQQRLGPDRDASARG